jgi:Protein of unknown function (DUF1553)/Protein of unknown function (DUF1549)/Planctomycete cytochrome C
MSGCSPAMFLACVVRLAFLSGAGFVVPTVATQPAFAVPGAPASGDPVEFFEARVRPILVQWCYGCHSTAAKKSKGGLRLDTRAAVLKGGGLGAALVPGSPDQSLIIRAVRRKEEDIEMPPDEALPADEVAVLEAWVAMGAPDPRDEVGVAAEDPQANGKKHWAFQPVGTPALPACKGGPWCANPIDRFVAETRASRGLEPAQPADPRTLLRRVTYDLTGLPPAPEEVRRFVADRSPKAYARAVDRLLASPAYGERWGRHWLDVARYADTKGYTGGEERRFPFSYTYRDWVIEAFNRDMPYDRFVVEQLAADRLVAGTSNKRSLAALGFLTLGRRFLDREPDIIDDRIDVAMRGTMGLTVTCARCHDHKYDPISIRDYYALYGVFASTEQPEDLPLLHDEGSDPQARSPLRREFASLLAEHQGKLDAMRTRLRNEILPTVLSAEAIANYLMVFADGTREGKQSSSEFVHIAEQRKLSGRVTTRWFQMLEASRVPGHSLSGVFALWHRLVTLPAAEFAQRAPGEVRAVRSSVVDSFTADFPAEPASLRAVAEQYARLFARCDRPLQLDPMFTGKNAPLQVALTDVDVMCTEGTPDCRAIKQINAKVFDLTLSHVGAPPRAVVIVDRPKPVDPHVFIRGNPDRPGEAVPRQFLAFLSGGKPEPFRDGSGRLELAHAITNPGNPLTARVWANRVWSQHFGRGLVPTPSDFGVRTDPPSHPALLDHLARTLIDGGWSTKKLHRAILLSRTYQQSSHPTTASLTADPDNRWLTRANRRRLDFEAMRDTFLQVSGQLDLRRGGPPELFVDNPGAEIVRKGFQVNRKGKVDPEKNRYGHRRSVYLFIDRQDIPGAFRIFDFASPDTHNSGCHETSVPQQGLFLLNDPFVGQAARALAERIEKQRPASASARVTALYQDLLARVPDAGERALGEAFLRGTDDGVSGFERYAQALLVSNEMLFLD